MWKNLLPGLLLGVFTLIMSSCISGKDWICVCQNQFGEEKMLLPNQTKKDAEKLCSYIEQKWYSDSNGSCEVKSL